MAQPGAPVVEDAFGVIANPLRRQMLERLASGEHRVSDLAAGLPISRPAVSQHLRLMLDVGVVVERRHGRERLYSLHPEPLADIEAWLRRLDEFWEGRLHRIARHLETRP